MNSSGASVDPLEQPSVEWRRFSASTPEVLQAGTAQDLDAGRIAVTEHAVSLDRDRQPTSGLTASKPASPTRYEADSTGYGD